MEKADLLSVDGGEGEEAVTPPPPHPHNDPELICFSHSFILPFIYLIDIYCAPSIS